jgi:hypothetical protein
MNRGAGRYRRGGWFSGVGRRKFLLPSLARHDGLCPSLRPGGVHVTMDCAAAFASGALSTDWKALRPRPSVVLCHRRRHRLHTDNIAMPDRERKGYGHGLD